MARARFPKGSSKVGKASAGRTSLQNTPVTIRSSVKLGEVFERNIRTQLASRVGHAAGVIGRITVRFDDVNGPKGGIDSVCRIKAMMPGQAPILVEKQAASPAVAFGRAVSAFGTAVDRARGKRGLSAGRKATTTKATTAKPKAAKPKATKAAPRKASTTKASTTKASTTKAAAKPAASTARRTTLGRTTRATAVQEDSKTKPSRKSTRGSANRAVPSQTKGRAVATKLQRPAARTKRKA